MEMKYFKPKSLTWWSGVAPLAAGVTVATVPLHGQVEIVDAVNNMTDNETPHVLIATGAAIIGLRGAM